MERGKSNPHPYEIETIFVIRFPEDTALRIKNKLETNTLEDSLFLDIDVDYNRGKIRFENEILYSKLCNLPCIIECLKTLDRKTYYKSGDISQILLCQKEPFQELCNENAMYRRSNRKERDKRFLYNHGLTLPLKNVRKRRFRKIIKKKTLDLAQIEKEVRRLLQVDNEAENVTWELLYDDNTKIQQQAQVGGDKSMTETMEKSQKSSSSPLPQRRTKSPSKETPLSGEKKGSLGEVNSLEGADATAADGALSQEEDSNNAQNMLDEADLFGESLSSSSSGGSQDGGNNSSAATASEDSSNEDEDTPTTSNIIPTYDLNSPQTGEKLPNSPLTPKPDPDASNTSLSDLNNPSTLNTQIYERLAEIERKKQTYISDLDNVENPALRQRFEKMLQNLSEEEAQLREQLFSN